MKPRTLFFKKRLFSTRKLFMSGLIGMGVLHSVMGTDNAFVNDGIIGVGNNYPPVIDATNFVNNNQFYATNDFLNDAYYFFNTLNYTNRGLMEASTGFIFDTSPSSFGVSQAAANFVNLNPVNAANAKIYGGQGLDIWATNIVNRGILTAGANGLLSLKGETVNLTRSSLRVGGFEDETDFFFPAGVFFGFFFGLSEPGIFDAYWGTSTNAGFGNFVNSPYTTPFHQVTNLANGFYNPFIQTLSFTNLLLAPNQLLSNRMSNLRQTDGTGTNYTLTVVYLRNSNNVAMPMEVRFQLGGDFYNPVVQWKGVSSNRVTGLTVTNWLYLSDDFGSSGTNLQVITNFPISSFFGKPTCIPRNYTFTRATESFFTDAPVPIPDPGRLFNGSEVLIVESGSSTAYGASMAPVTQLPDGGGGGAGYADLLGRVEITADKELDLTQTRIDGLNYLLLRATNHYAGSSGANITVPYSDIYLASTNGSMVLTNFLQPLPRCLGEVYLWSGRYTNNVSFPTGLPGGNGLPAQVRYHILFVDSRLTPESPAFVNDMTLQVRNSPTGTNSITINGPLNIINYLSIEAEQLIVGKSIRDVAGTWITDSIGELNFFSPNILWSNSLPNLKWLANEGRIVTLNAAYFGSATRPYAEFINHGYMATEGSRIWSDVFVNTGTNIAGSGPLSLVAQTVTLTGVPKTNAVFSAPNGDLTIVADDLVASNLVMAAGRTLSLSITTRLTDGGTNASNFWSCGDGFELLVKPASGDLLGTTLTNWAYDMPNVINTWSAEDRGANPSGYANNAAIGHLVLERSTNNLFTFQGTGPNQAIYVDWLELKNFPTNGNLSSPLNFINGVANPLTLYYAKATVNGVDASDRLNNENGGRLRWVTDYVGGFSAISMTLRNGAVILVSQALAGSSTMDSDADGLMNNVDTFPFDGPNMTAVMTPAATNKTVTISWNAAPATLYSVDWTTNLVDWQFLTNRLSGSGAGQLSVQDVEPVGSPRFYRVRYAP